MYYECKITHCKVGIFGMSQFSPCGYQHQVASVIYCIHPGHVCTENRHVFHRRVWDKRLWMVEMSRINIQQIALGSSGSLASRKNEVLWLIPGVLLATGPQRDPWLTCTISSDTQHQHTHLCWHRWATSGTAWYWLWRWTTKQPHAPAPHQHELIPQRYEICKDMKSK